MQYSWGVSGKQGSMSVLNQSDKGIFGVLKSENILPKQVPEKNRKNVLFDLQTVGF